ncbi:unnamed protein product [Orchesella dallaii]|uniref:Voltage-dependent calcium channel gamma-5 subunit n=1 Tax=Orchesella dallaii TaxID=48710 RepID=A0ABP1S3U1_9HEXA
MTLYAKRARKLLPILSILIPGAALISVVSVVVCMCTGSWLHSYERIPISNSSSTHEEFLIKRTISGLWHIWSFNLTEKEVAQDRKVSTENMDCMTIEYFRRERYLSDPNDSTNAIALCVTSAGPIFISASALLVIAVVSAAFGYQRHWRVAIFVAGSIFIVAGLILLIGLVVYLSVLQSEIGPKLRPRNSVEKPLFSYFYGYSFVMVVVGFLATELTGIFAIFFYMYWHQKDWAEKALKENQYYHSGNSGSTRSRMSGEQQTINMQWCPRRPRPDSLPFQSSGGCNHHSLASCEHHDDPIDLCKGHEHLSRKGLSYDTEYDIPIPPPPPPASSLPRDYTTLTSCSDDTFVPDLQLHSLGRTKCKDRRITPV